MRKSGILLHISCLPSPYGIGTLGIDAFKFVDFLRDSGQTYWQILPIGPTSYGDSPYSSFSAFAGNPYFVDLDLLVNENLLTKEEILSNIDYPIDPQYVWYGELYNCRYKILKIAYSHFIKNNEFYNFINENYYWLDGYSKFMSLKNKYNGIEWHNWDKCYWDINSNEVKEFIENNKEEYYYWCFIQYKFFTQFNNLKEYANKNGIKLIGDMPIYVAYDSADVWSDPKNWQLDDDFVPKRVAGVPPDALSDTGQLWGNPLYDYNAMKKNNYSWWINRFKHSFNLFDYVRADHFRGFESYWSIPYGDSTAVNGKWVKGPGYDLFSTIKKELGELNIIAEDLGIITDEVRTLLKKCGFPGMKILEFGFDPWGESNYAPHNHSSNYVCYPGTHDNETLRQWFDNMNYDLKKYIYEYLNIHNDNEAVIRMICTCLASTCDYAIVMLTDWLELGKVARFNEPSTVTGNWVYRITYNQLNDHLREKVKYYTKLYRR